MRNICRLLWKGGPKFWLLMKMSHFFSNKAKALWSHSKIVCFVGLNFLQIRVSSEISNGQITLNVDCDMYSNNSQSIREALCFLMDQENGGDIAFVQFPQVFENVTRNDLYGSDLRYMEVTEFD